MDYDSELSLLSSKFTQDYPPAAYPELMHKHGRPYTCLLIETHYNYLICVPFRSFIGHFAAVASGLPKNPDSLLENGWKEVTDPRAKASSNSRVFKEKSTGLRIRFDREIPGDNGFRGKDHYHIDNPNATDKKIGRYLDKNGNPVSKNSKASHILPERGH